ncbi:MAG: AzlC family ABC transporter permease, partial [Chloroflexi bacterium]|nr:AzlC family ABC transporter permease [Chloroflexota bacterium]
MFARITRGFKATLPVALGVMPFGVAFGAVAGLTMTWWQAQLMSLTLFAGTAQFITASMIAEGAAFLPILITGTLINMRLILLSAALTPYLTKARRSLYPLMAQVLTDESFAVTLAEFERGKPDYLFFVGSGLAVYSLWQVATLIGHTFGSALPAGLGLEYALAASLMYLLIILARTRRAVAVALFAGLLTLALYPLLSNTWSTVTATFIAAT